MIVVDASVLVDALADDGDVGHRAREALAQDAHWAAPAHLVVEVVSAIRGRVRGGKLGIRRAQDAIDALGEIEIDPIDVWPLAGLLWRLRDNFRPYDAAYVVAAEQQGCALMTADSRLAAAARGQCEVRLIG